MDTCRRQCHAGGWAQLDTCLIFNWLKCHASHHDDSNTRHVSGIQDHARLPRCSLIDMHDRYRDYDSNRKYQSFSGWVSITDESLEHIGLMHEYQWMLSFLATVCAWASVSPTHWIGRSSYPPFYGRLLPCFSLSGFLSNISVNCKNQGQTRPSETVSRCW